MGGLGRIWFSSISGYSERHGIVGSAFDDFLIFIRAVDDEYVAVMNERAAAEAEKNKQKT